MTNRTCSVEGCDDQARSRGWCWGHYHRWRKYGDPTGASTYEPKRIHPLTRFMSKVDPQSNGCWLWTGSLSTSGYGKFGLTHADIRPAHRWIWEHVNGPIPHGLQMDHFACDTRSCVNPTHVRPVTPRENSLRTSSPLTWNLSKTHCPQGHPYAGDNLIVNQKTGKRKCRTCLRAHHRRYYAEKKARKAA